jgi:hypothetical protein
MDPDFKISSSGKMRTEQQTELDAAVRNAAIEAEQKLNQTCYIKVTKFSPTVMFGWFEVLNKILTLMDKSTDFDYKMFYDHVISENFSHAFDDLNNLNVHVIDQLLNLYDVQLKYFVPQKTEYTKIKQQLLDLYEKKYYVGLIWKHNHYQVLGKFGSLFILYDPFYDYPIRHTYRELVEYISNDGVELFFVHDGIDEEYHLDWFLEEPIYGGGKAKPKKRKVLNSV